MNDGDDAALNAYNSSCALMLSRSLSDWLTASMCDVLGLISSLILLAILLVVCFVCCMRIFRSSDLPYPVTVHVQD